MRFPRKFQRMLEIKLDDVERPDEVWLTYAVCACFHDSCAWHGWIVESVARKGELLPADTHQQCPQCSKETFPTAARLRLVPSRNRTQEAREDEDWVTEIEYE